MIEQTQIENTSSYGSAGSFVEFAVALVKLFPPQLVVVESESRYNHDEAERQWICQVELTSQYTGEVTVRIDCASELESQVLTAKVRRAVDAVSTFGL